MCFGLEKCSLPKMYSSLNIPFLSLNSPAQSGHPARPQCRPTAAGSTDHAASTARWFFIYDHGRRRHIRSRTIRFLRRRCYLFHILHGTIRYLALLRYAILERPNRIASRASQLTSEQVPNASQRELAGIHRRIVITGRQVRRLEIDLRQCIPSVVIRVLRRGSLVAPFRHG